MNLNGQHFQSFPSNPFSLKTHFKHFNCAELSVLKVTKGATRKTHSSTSMVMEIDHIILWFYRYFIREPGGNTYKSGAHTQRRPWKQIALFFINFS